MLVWIVFVFKVHLESFGSYPDHLQAELTFGFKWRLVCLLLSCVSMYFILLRKNENVRKKDTLDLFYTIILHISVSFSDQQLQSRWSSDRNIHLETLYWEKMDILWWISMKLMFVRRKLMLVNAGDECDSDLMYSTPEPMLVDRVTDEDERKLHLTLWNSWSPMGLSSRGTEGPELSQ